MSDDQSRFCGACGSALMPGDTFCTSCGARATAEPPAPPESYTPEPTPAPAPTPTPQPPSADSSETVVAVIGNLTEIGGFMGLKQKTYTLVITETRIIFARLTKERMSAMVNAARDEAKSAGKGFFGQWGAQIGTSMKYHEEYWQMTPAAALAETEGNFAIDRSAIRGMKYKHGMTNDDGTSSPDRMIITTTSGKHKLQVSGSVSAVKKALAEVGIS